MSNTFRNLSGIKNFKNAYLKRGILFFTLIVFTNSLGFAHEEPSKTLKEKNEKNQKKKQITGSKIKTITVWKYVFENELETTAKNKSLVMGYDRTGNLSFIEAYKNDSLSEKAEYTYNANGDMLSDFDLSSEGKIVEKNFFSYDNEGRVISGISKNDNDSITGSFKIQPAKDKQSIEFVKYFPDNKIEYKLIYKYKDDFDKSDYTEACKYDSTGKLLLKVEKTYNPKGWQEKKIIYDSSNKISYFFLYGYDKKGNNNMITKKLADDNIEWEDQYIFDNNGNCTEMKSYDKEKKLKIHLLYIFENYTN
jgi:hypothetical protein